MVEIISLIYSFLLFVNHNFNPKKFKNHTHACVRLVYVFKRTYNFVHYDPL